jgi:hypothetical protein
MIASVSVNDVYCLCFRIFTLSCCAWSALVRWRPSSPAAIVTQLVTEGAFFGGLLPGGLSLSAQPLSVGGHLDANFWRTSDQYGHVCGVVAKPAWVVTKAPARRVFWRPVAHIRAIRGVPRDLCPCPARRQGSIV